MQTVVANFTSRNAAEWALRELESHGLSIQNFVIADKAHSAWRPLRGAHEHQSGSFVVFTMDEDLELIDRARGLLSPPSTPL